MSATTETAERGQLADLLKNNSSTGLLSIRAAIPSLVNAADPRQRDSENRNVGEDIELAELARTSPQATATAEDPDLPIANEISHISSKWAARIQFAAVCWAVLLIGWNDGTTGPLLPRIQSHYHVISRILLSNKLIMYFFRKIGYATVSLIFVLSCVVRPAYKLVLSLTC